jgi:hypothetical protein
MGNVGHMAASRNSTKNTKNLNFQPVSYIGLFFTHIELELGMLGIAKKLLKDVIHLWR